MFSILIQIALKFVFTSKDNWQWVSIGSCNGLAQNKWQTISWANVNSLLPSDAIRRQGTESTLAQVMACCLTAPCHLPEPMLTYHQYWVRSCGIHQRALSWEDLKIPISKTRLKITVLESHSDLPVANELTRLPCMTWLRWVDSSSKLHAHNFKVTSLVWNQWTEVSLVIVSGYYWWLVNIGSGNGLVLSANKPLPEPTPPLYWKKQQLSFQNWLI